MATVRRETKRINRYKVKKIQAYTVLILLVVFGIVIGVVIGKITTPKAERVTITETVEVPSYRSEILPSETEVTYFDIPLSKNLQRYIYEICSDEKVPVTLVMAMIEHESKFDPETVSNTDDYGLMQINEINHSELEEKYRAADMLNPYQNVFCGVKILGSYLEKYDNDYAKALMAYNMGDYGARKAWSNGVTSTDYTVRILGLWEYYEEVLSNATGNSDE